MWLTIIIAIVFITAVFTIIYLFWKKIPQIRIIDPDSHPTGASRKLKGDIMRSRVQRASGDNWKKIQKSVIDPAGKSFQLFVRRVAGKLTAAERRFQEKAREESGEKMTPIITKKAIEESQKFIASEMWDRAEKVLIQVISEDPKNIEAYEQLGRLYLLHKDYVQALETFQFLSKLAPGDASVIAYLGQTEDQLKHTKKALKHFEKAVELNPKNPKYLDLLIASAIKTGDRHLATVTVDRLKEVNPENKKIEQYSKEIGEMKKIDLAK
ncbi:tetratricopeptide repeat protein [Patescibacteria group bacterium]|nr:tetratricopeptide repeat protein [Patescibacteria group bacterium]